MSSVCAIDYAKATPEQDRPVDVTRYEIEVKTPSGKKVTKSFKKASSREIKRAANLLRRRLKPKEPAAPFPISSLAGLLSGKMLKCRIAPCLSRAKEKLKDMSPRPTVSLTYVKKGADPLVDLRISNVHASRVPEALGLLTGEREEFELPGTERVNRDLPVPGPTQKNIKSRFRIVRHRFDAEGVRFAGIKETPGLVQPVDNLPVPGGLRSIAHLRVSLGVDDVLFGDPEAIVFRIRRRPAALPGRDPQWSDRPRCPPGGEIGARDVEGLLRSGDTVLRLPDLPGFCALVKSYFRPDRSSRQLKTRLYTTQRRSRSKSSLFPGSNHHLGVARRPPLSNHVCHPRMLLLGIHNLPYFQHSWIPVPNGTAPLIVRQRFVQHHLVCPKGAASAGMTLLGSKWKTKPNSGVINPGRSRRNLQNMNAYHRSAHLKPNQTNALIKKKRAPGSRKTSQRWDTVLPTKSSN